MIAIGKSTMVEEYDAGLPLELCDAEVGLDEGVEPLDAEPAAELGERARDHPAVYGADDPRVSLRQLVERAAAHQDLVVADLGAEALLVEERDDLGGRVLVAQAGREAVGG